jgi:hypothetical protein
MLSVLVAVLLAQATPSVSPSPTPSVPVTSPVTLSAEPSSLGLHAGAATTVRIQGASGSLVASAGPLVTVTVDQATQTLSVTAAGQLGRDTIHITDATGAALDVPVLIAQDAGSVPAVIALKVTGSPIDPQWLTAQVRNAVSRNVQVQPGATLAPPAATDPPAPPLPGSSVTVPVQVAIEGNGTYLDVAATTNVSIQNVPAEPFAPPTLMYDDDPEHITGDGVVFRGTVAPGAPSRLYYYHDNAADPRHLAVVLSSASSAPTSVQVIDATSGPNIDVMSVGHAVSRDFLLMKPRNQGVVYDLAPDQPLVLHDLPMSGRQGVAGTIGFNVMSGGPVSVTVVAASPGVDPRSLLSGAALPRDGHHRTGVFDITNFGTASLAYAAGGSDASIVIADREPTPQNVNPTDTGHDYGDYGVIHTFLFSIQNPTSEPANVYLYERPIGGVVRSSFVVDGNLVEMGCVRQNTTRYQIAAFTLAPNQRYQMTVRTMTDGGSNYPLEVGLTGTAPQPTTPPISAPDGCFPKNL